MESDNWIILHHYHCCCKSVCCPFGSTGVVHLNPNRLKKANVSPCDWVCWPDALHSPGFAAVSLPSCPDSWAENRVTQRITSSSQPQYPTSLLQPATSFSPSCSLHLFSDWLRASAGLFLEELTSRITRRECIVDRLLWVAVVADRPPYRKGWSDTMVRRAVVNTNHETLCEISPSLHPPFPVIMCQGT